MHEDDDVGITQKVDVEAVVTDLSRQVHGGQRVSFIELDHAEDMIAVHADSSAATVLFGTDSLRPNPGVEIVYQSDGEERYAFIAQEAWDHVCAHLVETNLHPEWSYARAISFGSSSTTMHKPRGLIVPQGKGLRGLMGWRALLARKLGRPIYTELELTDGSTVWERWS